jgi:hypothetical protein
MSDLGRRDSDHVDWDVVDVVKDDDAVSTKGAVG